MRGYASSQAPVNEKDAWYVGASPCTFAVVIMICGVVEAMAANDSSSTRSLSCE